MNAQLHYLRPLLIVASLGLAATVHAQGYPSKPIRFVVASQPGGLADMTPRLMAPKLQERSEEHTSELPVTSLSRMPSSA